MLLNYEQLFELVIMSRPSLFELILLDEKQSKNKQVTSQYTKELGLILRLIPL